MAAPGFRASKLILAGLALGALFFVASDLLLALILFVVIRPAQKRLLGHVLWAAYWSGQMLILLGMTAVPPF